MSPRTVQQNELIREQRKAQIIEAAFHVFGQTGYVSSSMAQIAKKAKVSKGLLYNYFESKEVLLLRMFEFFLKDMEAFWNKDESLSPKENLKALLDSSFELINSHREMSRLISQLALQKEAMKSLEGHVEGMLIEKLHLLEDILRDMGVENYKEESLFIGALLDGIGFGALVLEDRYPLEKMKQKVYKQYNL